MTYDKKLIVVAHPTHVLGKQTLIDGASAIKKAKGGKRAVIDPTSDNDVTEDKRAKFSELTELSKIYLFAHGGTTIAGVSGKNLAIYLCEKCELKTVGKISVIACGSNPAFFDVVKKFHLTLGEKGVMTDVYAYTFEIKVISEGDMALINQLSEDSEIRLTWKLGQRRVKTSDAGFAGFERPRSVKLSKYIFGWVVGKQVFDYIY